MIDKIIFEFIEFVKSLPYKDYPDTNNRHYDVYFHKDIDKKGGKNTCEIKGPFKNLRDFHVVPRRWYLIEEQLLKKKYSRYKLILRRAVNYELISWNESSDSKETIFMIYITSGGNAELDYYNACKKREEP